MKTFVLGLDGSTFDLLNPLMEAGSIPNIKEIAENWTRGTLRSIFPPVTGPGVACSCFRLESRKNRSFRLREPKRGR